VLKRVVLLSLFLFIPTIAAAESSAPHEIRIGTLYAGSGAFASSSIPQYQGLRFWVRRVNARGGVFVKAYGRRIPVKLIAYNDQSQTGLAGSLYTQLITRDRVRILVADFGSVLTSVAIPLAEERQILLIDPTGTSAKFFRGNNRFLILTGLPSSGIWPTVLADFLIAHKIGRVAIIYSANDFTESQDQTLVSRIEAAGIHPVYNHAVANSTSSYTLLLHQAVARRAQALIELGYNNNDIALLQDLSAGGMHFAMVFTINPGLRVPLFLKAVGAQALGGTFTYVTPPSLAYNKVNYGLGLAAFKQAFEPWNRKHGNVPLGLSVIAGYNSGLIIQKALETAKRYDSVALRTAIRAVSGRLFTLDGLFKVDSRGNQIGEPIPLGQFFMSQEKLVLKVVYPAKVATAKPLYPAPRWGSGRG